MAFKEPGMIDQFRQDVKEGLSATPKFLSSKYFYDREGDRLFQDIMGLEEYYLTDCEHEILSTNRKELLEQFSSSCDKFHLIEFGAGDAYKTKVLISYFLQHNTNFEYNPIDISENSILNLQEDMEREFPDLRLAPINLEYFRALEKISTQDTCKKIIFFLGSNIGNFSMKDAQGFFNHMGDLLKTGDQALIGFDLRKDPETILKAYNDSEGITAEFNLNLLRRINRELDADFDPRAFYHHPVYDEVSGAARSYLVSSRIQEVRIAAIPMKVDFEREESIFMEVSQKYSLEETGQFAEKAGFLVKKDYFDHRKYFLNSLWEKK